MGQGSGCPCGKPRPASDGHRVHATQDLGRVPPMAASSAEMPKVAKEENFSDPGTLVLEPEKFLLSASEKPLAIPEKPAEEVDGGWRARAAEALVGKNVAEDLAGFSSTPMWMRGESPGGVDSSSRCCAVKKKQVTFPDEEAAEAAERARQAEALKDAASGAAALAALDLASTWGGTKRISPSAKGRAGRGGCCPCLPLRSKALSPEATAKVQALFAEMDADRSREVTFAEALAHCKGGFGKLSVAAMFAEVDVDLNKNISEDEFINFWQQVKKSGYTERQILEELDNLMEGGTWVDWEDERGVG